ncbi:MAG: ATP synthase F1 subunit gamma [Candidatus Aminicenantes bacterium]|nr:ATP synthase F1 subunit gamma [Candidatus Aminicenantes bacterium]
MSGNLIDLRRRIQSVKNTQKITQAMKTVSAVKLRKSTNELNKNKPFMDSVESLLKRVGQELPVETFPLLRKRKEGKPALVVVSADKGLCGAFNSHIIRRAEEHYENLCTDNDKPVLIIAGNKAFGYFQKKDYPIGKNFMSLMSKLTFKGALELSTFLQELYQKDEIMKVEIVYTEFLSASKQEPAVKQLFPIPIEWEDQGGEEKEVEYIFEPDPAKIFQSLLPKYLDSLIYRLLRESEASAHAARMIAMEMATRNTKDMIRTLILNMNKLRQAAITNELLEIITATEAMKK